MDELEREIEATIEDWIQDGKLITRDEAKKLIEDRKKRENEEIKN